MQVSAEWRRRWCIRRSSMAVAARPVQVQPLNLNREIPSETTVFHNACCRRGCHNHRSPWPSPAKAGHPDRSSGVDNGPPEQASAASAPAIQQGNHSIDGVFTRPGPKPDILSFLKPYRSLILGVVGAWGVLLASRCFCPFSLTARPIINF